MTRVVSSFGPMMPDALVGLLELFSEERLLGPKGPLPINDDPAPRLFVVDEGVVQQFAEVGRNRQALAVHYPNDGISHWFPGLRLKGLRPSKLRIADIEEVRDLAARNAKVATFLRHGVQSQFERATQWQHKLSQPADERLAHFLCEQAIRIGGDQPAQSFRLQTQAEMADAIAVTGIHVNRVLRAFEEAGYISREASWLTILDWDELKRLGGFREDVALPSHR